MKERFIIQLFVILASLGIVWSFAFGPYDFPGFVETAKGKLEEYRSQKRLTERALLSVCPTESIPIAGKAASYINYFPYTQSSCNGGSKNQYSLGMGVCVLVRSSAPDDDYTDYYSLMSYFNESSYNIYTNFYVSCDCSGSVLFTTLYAPLGVAPMTCRSSADDDTAFIYSITESFQLPNSNGFYETDYNAQGCMGSPFNARWSASQTDDFNESPKSCVSVTNMYTKFTEYYYENAGTTSKSSKKKCFSGTEVVQLKSGELKPIQEIEVGTSILSADLDGNLKFSEVVAVPHENDDRFSSFVRLVLESGNDVKVTSDHLLLVQPQCNVSSSRKLQRVSDIELDMCLVTTEGQEKVVSKSNVIEKGTYSVITSEEYIVVNGVIASPFAVNHVVASAYYSIIKLFPGILSFSWIARANEYFGYLVSAFADS